MRTKRTWHLWPSLRRTAENWMAHDAPRLGASLAFYTILSMSPLVLLAVAIAALVFDRASAQKDFSSLSKGMLCLADSGFFGFERWRKQ